MEKGKVIIGRDFKRFLMVEMPNGDLGLVDLQTYDVAYIDVISQYMSEYHYGIDKMTDIVILNKK